MACAFAVSLVGALAAIQTNDCSRPGEICEISTAGQGFKHDTAVVHGRRNLRGDLASVNGTCDSNLNCVATGGSSNCPVDIIFVLDGSTSISSSSWDSLIAACEQMVTNFGVSASGAHVGVVQFASTSQSKLELPLSGNASVVHKLFSGLKQLHGSTDTATGLSIAAKELKSHSRTGSTSVAILITDGQSDAGSHPIPVATALKKAGTTIIGVGVGQGADMGQITAIASAPASEFVFKLDSFSKLETIVKALVAKTCVGVLSVDPTHGPSSGGTVVVVTGFGFSCPTAQPLVCQCKFGTEATPVIKFVNSTTVACRTPAGTGDVSLAFSPDGTFFAPKTGRFRYDEPECPSKNCDGHGTCVAGECLCNAGWVGPNCDKHACPKDCCGHGTCDPNSGSCTCREGYMGSDCCEEEILCCQYCMPDPNNPGHYKPNHYLAECWKGFCPSRFPDVLVKQTSRPNMNACIYGAGRCQDTGLCH